MPLARYVLHIGLEYNYYQTIKTLRGSELKILSLIKQLIMFVSHMWCFLYLNMWPTLGEIDGQPQVDMADYRLFVAIMIVIILLL